jgi:hypothetical protein
MLGLMLLALGGYILLSISTLNVELDRVLERFMAEAEAEKMRNSLIHIGVGNVAHLRASMGRDGAEGLEMTLCWV